MSASCNFGIISPCQPADTSEIAKNLTRTKNLQNHNLLTSDEDMKFLRRFYESSS